MNEAIIKFDKVVKRFGDVTVLDSLDFEVRKGEKVSIIGPSGSGKSTVLRILMTLETIKEGVIHVAGKPLWHQYQHDALVPAGEDHLREMRKEMGMVFQQFNLFPHMTVRRNVTRSAGQVLGMSRKKRPINAAEELLGLVGLSRSGRQIPAPVFGRPAAARSHCAGDGDAAQHHAFRRADIGARSGTGRRSAPGIEAPGRRT